MSFEIPSPSPEDLERLQAAFLALARDQHPHTCSGTCWHAPFGYAWCHGCGEHHREPVAGPGEACPVDVRGARGVIDLPESSVREEASRAVEEALGPRLCRRCGARHSPALECPMKVGRRRFVRRESTTIVFLAGMAGVDIPRTRVETERLEALRAVEEQLERRSRW